MPAPLVWTTQRIGTDALFVMVLLTHSVIIRWGVGVMGTAFYRHDSLHDALFSTAQSAALGPRKEVPSLIPNTRSHPADIFLPSWKKGCPAVLDVSVISTLQQLTMEGAATVQDHALRVDENAWLILQPAKQLVRPSFPWWLE